MALGVNGACGASADEFHSKAEDLLEIFANSRFEYDGRRFGLSRSFSHPGEVDGFPLAARVKSHGSLCALRRRLVRRWQLAGSMEGSRRVPKRRQMNVRGRPMSAKAFRAKPC